MLDRVTKFAKARDMLELYGEEAHEMAWAHARAHLEVQNIDEAMTWLDLAQTIEDLWVRNQQRALH